MLLTCPQCGAIFRVDRLQLHPAGQLVHSMICDHIRAAWLLNSGDQQDMLKLVPDIPKILLPVMRF